MSDDAPVLDQVILLIDFTWAIVTFKTDANVALVDEVHLKDLLILLVNDLLS